MGLPMYDGNLHHIEAHFPVDHGYGPTGVFFPGKNSFSISILKVLSFDIKKTNLNFLRVKMDMVSRGNVKFLTRNLQPVKFPTNPNTCKFPTERERPSIFQHP